MCLHVISFNLPREIAVLHPDQTTTLGSPEGKAVILTLSNAKGKNPRILLAPAILRAKQPTHPKP